MEVQDSKIYFFPFPAELPDRSKICWWSHSIILICGDLDLDLKVSEKIFSSDLRSTLPTEEVVLNILHSPRISYPSKLPVTASQKRSFRCQLPQILPPGLHN
nr:uncharacterized protein LOC107129614 isoform X2 [Macaca fascicularis]